MRRRPSASNSDEEDDTRSDESNALRDPVAQSPSDTSPVRPTSSNLLLPNRHQQKQSKPSRKQSRQARSASNSASKSPWKPSSAQSSDAKSERHLRLPSRDITPSNTPNSSKMALRARLRNPWAASWLSIAVLLSAAALLLTLYQSVTQRQLDTKGGSMSYMASSFVRFSDFDTEHTRFATKYSLHLYREMGVDEDPRVSVCTSS